MAFRDFCLVLCEAYLMGQYNVVVAADDWLHLVLSRRSSWAFLFSTAAQMLFEIILSRFLLRIYAQHSLVARGVRCVWQRAFNLYLRLLSLLVSSFTGDRVATQRLQSSHCLLWYNLIVAWFRIYHRDTIRAQCALGILNLSYHCSGCSLLLQTIHVRCASNILKVENILIFATSDVDTVDVWWPLLRMLR